LLEGKNVNLRRAEKEDVSSVAQWWSSSEYMGEYQDVLKISQAELEKVMLEDTVFFIIEKKDGAEIGHINGWMRGRMMEIGFALVLGGRGKGHGTEVMQLIVDYLFLKKDVVRIQTSTDTRNVASQRALEKAGFLKEGTMRKSWYAKGNYRDHHLYSILRKEWKEPKILTKTASQN